MNIERSLVLNRYVHGLFGAERFDELRRALKEQEEGPGPDGRSRFFHVLAGRSGLKIEVPSLEEYDRRIMGYEAGLAKSRRVEPFKHFKYFQYLALLYTEIFLDRMTVVSHKESPHFGLINIGDAVDFRKYLQEKHLIGVRHDHNQT